MLSDNRPGFFPLGLSAGTLAERIGSEALAVIRQGREDEALSVAT